MIKTIHRIYILEDAIIIIITMIIIEKILILTATINMHNDTTNIEDERKVFHKNMAIN